MKFINKSVTNYMLEYFTLNFLLKYNNQLKSFTFLNLNIDYKFIIYGNNFMTSLHESVN